MKFKKWLIGVAMAFLLSACVAGSGLVAGMKWQALLAVFCTALLTHLTAWMKEHPVETIDLANVPINNKTDTHDTLIT